MALRTIAIDHAKMAIIDQMPSDQRHVAMKTGCRELADAVTHCAGGGGTTAYDAAAASVIIDHVDDVDVLSAMMASDRRVFVANSIRARRSQLLGYTTPTPRDDWTGRIMASLGGTRRRTEAVRQLCVTHSYDQAAILAWYQTLSGAERTEVFQEAGSHVFFELGAAIAEDIANSVIAVEEHTAWTAAGLLETHWKAPLNAAIAHVLCFSPARNNMLDNGADARAMDVFLRNERYDLAYLCGMGDREVLEAATKRRNFGASIDGWVALCLVASVESLSVIAPGLIAHSQSASGVATRNWWAITHRAGELATYDFAAALAVLSVATAREIHSVVVDNRWGDTQIAELVERLEACGQVSAAQLLSACANADCSITAKRLVDRLVRHGHGIHLDTRWLQRWVPGLFAAIVCEALGDSEEAWRVFWALQPGWCGTTMELLDTVAAVSFPQYSHTGA